MNTSPTPGSDTNVDLATLLTAPLERGKACVECRRKKQVSNLFHIWDWKHVLLAIADGSIITGTDSIFDCDRDLLPSVLRSYSLFVIYAALSPNTCWRFPEVRWPATQLLELHPYEPGLQLRKATCKTGINYPPRTSW